MLNLKLNNSVIKGRKHQVGSQKSWVKEGPNKHEYFYWLYLKVGIKCHNEWVAKGAKIVMICANCYGTGRKILSVVFIILFYLNFPLLI